VIRSFLNCVLVSLALAAFAAPAWAQCDDQDRDGDSFSCLAGDCDDTRNVIYPGAPELCDGLDNNCDTINDNPPDGDGDGQNVCQGDCDDANAQRFQGNPEVCDGLDNDCSAATLDSAITRACYTGPAGTNNRGLCHGGTQTCQGAAGFGMCVGQVTPQPETCDAADRDCDGNPVNGQPDADGDGATICTDCDDANAMRTPGRPEVCDGVDNDCNAATMDGALTQACYSGPAGTNGRGLCRGGTRTCQGAAGYGMCVGEILPQPETCDAADRDCDGNPVNGQPDADGDGATICTDCDDNNNLRAPGRPELCDGIDNDCNAATLDSALTQSCYSGPAGTAGRGICRAGSRACQGAGGFGMCTGEILPETETCDAADRDCDGNPTNGQPDADGDGTNACTDCDDNNAMRAPGRPEVCDGVDNDCNAATLDTSLTRACYTGPAGTQGRGLCRGGNQACTGSSFGACNGEVTPSAEMCDAPDQDCDGSGFNGFPNVDNDPVPACLGDCDDNNPARYPGNAEICDGIDNDCDNIIDENFDNDGDGVTTCGGDCNDNNNQIFPGAPEACNGIDDDCDNMIDEDFPDMDGDGFRACGPNPDCDDMNNRRFPGNPETCDGIDNDCDAFTDERDAAGNPLRQACYRGPAGTNGVGTCRGGNVDCAMGNFNGACVGEVVPRAEMCDSLDDDCDRSVDEDFDVDRDMFTSCMSPTPDCDDNNNRRFPGNPEVCDGLDNDCDLLTDERNAQGQPLTRACYSGPMGTNGVGTCRSGNVSCMMGTFNGTCVGETIPRVEMCDRADDDCDTRTDEDFDVDMDGVTSCAATPDCNDMNAMVRPGGTEVCDGLDNDCDLMTDENLRQACYSGPVGTEGIGPCRAGFAVCIGAAGYSMTCGMEVVPAASDICDGIDNDCDGETDEGFDMDADGFTTCNGDCDDTNAAVNPDAIELCNNRDDDCDMTVDGNMTACYSGPVGTATVGLCHPGMGICVNGTAGTCVGEVVPVAELCDTFDNDCDGDSDEDFDADRDGVTTCAGDCDDTNAFKRPGLVERCDCDDNDCDTDVDEDGFGGTVCSQGACHDFDADGFTNCDGDCDDRNARFNPGAAEICGDALDNDCDGAVDENVDEDGDGFTTCDGDCDDRFTQIHPGAVEVCDNFDNDCNGQTDEGFDVDGDFATTCAGDCDDNDRNRNPFRREICANGIDDDCDGLVDPDVDEDGDGVTTCGGDCNDFNTAVFRGHPEICDGQDNDCNNQVDEGFDLDRDSFATCFGDCNDMDPLIGPFAREKADLIDNNCDGNIDEGSDDPDGDGFSFLCGDCKPNDARIGPQIVEICDGIDNDCDGVFDRDTRGRSVCQSCNDVDNDGIQDCDGDCDDTNASVKPGGTEICDGIDNDCNGSVDLDRITRENLCTNIDAGVRPDTGLPPVTDAGVDPRADAAMSAVVDTGAAPDAGQSELERIAKVECGCRAVAPVSSDRGPPWLVIVGLGLFLLRGRRRLAVLLGPRAAALLLALVTGCTEIQVGAGGDDAAVAADRVLSGDARGLDAAAAPDADSRDVGVTDLGPINQGPCRLDDEDSTRIIDSPARDYPFAIHRSITTTALGGVQGFALDDEALGLRGFFVRRTLDATFDRNDPGAGGKIIDSVLDPAMRGLIPGVVGVASRVDESLKTVFLRDINIGARTLRTITMPNDILVSRMRDGLLANVLGVPLANVSGLPSIVGELPQRTVTLAAYVDVSTGTTAADVMLALVPEAATSSAATVMNDLTNGTHLGPPGGTVGLECDTSTATALKVDFLWVVDNSASMQEEQRALALAADTFFAALSRSRIDFRLAVVTTDGEALRGGGFTTDLDTFKDRVRVGINGNGNEQGIEYAVRALERAATATDTEAKLRSDAIPVVVLYTDEESSNLRTIPQYVTALRALNALPFAIVGPRPRGCQAVGRGVARVGETYIQLVEAMGGGSASICAEDLTRPIEQILIAAAGAASQTRLSQIPISGSLEVQREVGLTARGRQNGFDYESASNAIVFFGDAAPPEGDTFRVAYRRWLPFIP